MAHVRAFGGEGMRTILSAARFPLGTAAALALGLGLGLSASAWGQAAPQTPSNDPSAQPAAQQPADQQSASQQTDKQQPAGQQPTADKPAPGTAPVAGDVPPPAQDSKADKKDKKHDKNKKDKDKDQADDENVKVDPDKVVEVGSEKVNVKPGSIEDVNAVGNRDIGGRGVGNWYSTDSEIKMGKMYASQIEQSTKFITDPVVTEYVNRVGQNIVKNSDCKVPFTIKVIDSDEINAMALPGGFFYVNSGLILAADEEAELAGVMAHETAHVCAHHAAREMTRMNYMQI